MPIYEEKRGRITPSLRVVVSVGGKMRQQLFSLKGADTKQVQAAVMKQAQRLELQWEKEAEIARKQKKANAKPMRNSNPIADSGVSGIKMKWRKRETGSGMHYSPMFLVSVAEGTCQCGIIDAGHKNGWKKAVSTYCNLKGINNQTSLLKRIPPKSKWEEVRQYYIGKFGWNIPEIEFKD